MKGNILKLMIVMLNGLDAYTIAEFNPKFFWNRPPEGKFHFWLMTQIFF